MLQKICESKKIEVLLLIGVDIHGVVRTYQSEQTQLNEVLELQKEAAQIRGTTY